MTANEAAPFRPGDALICTDEASVTLRSNGVYDCEGVEWIENEWHVRVGGVFYPARRFEPADQTA